MKKYTLTLSSLFIFLLSHTVCAEDNKLKLGLYGGLTIGGDDLVEIEYDDDADEEVTAGGLIAFGISIAQDHISDSNFNAKFNLGYHFDGSYSDDGESTFDRITSDILIGYQFTDEVSLYVGPTFHLGPELDVDIDDGPNFTVEFDDAVGAVVEGRYSFDQVTSEIAIRFVSIEYDVKDFDVDSIDGNHIGGYFYYYFE